MILKNMKEIALCGAISAPRIPGVHGYWTSQFVRSRADWESAISDLSSTGARIRVVHLDYYSYLYLEGVTLIPYRYTHNVIAGYPLETENTSIVSLREELQKLRESLGTPGAEKK